MCQSAPTSSPLQQSSALQQMWACRLGEGAPWMKREWGRERARCSWRMRPVFRRQVRFCPKSSHKTPQTFHKRPFNMHPYKHKQTHTQTLTQAFEADSTAEQWQARGLPQLFGIVLLNLCPLLHKFHILLHQLQARLCVLLNDVILVLEKGA